ncbi:hypothetical protein [Pectobacterium parmentieri]|uniref:hypothetical protein n=1 Tax=Pectobacterium parmentieri TaxID=1905730 RepID=UPI000E21DAFD|nr:hypothetical protein [Pectobacterium parmentieri]
MRVKGLFSQLAHNGKGKTGLYIAAVMTGMPHAVCHYMGTEKRFFDTVCANPDLIGLIAAHGGYLRQGISTRHIIRLSLARKYASDFWGGGSQEKKRKINVRKALINIDYCD